MTTWMEPVINRIGAGNEQYSYVDFNRAVNNIQYIIELLNSIGINPIPVSIPTMTMTTYPFPSVINALEQALKNLETSGVPLPIEWENAYPYWTSNQDDRTVNYRDMNRWEQSTAYLKMYADRVINSIIQTNVVMGMSYMGNSKRVQMFSRGR